MSEFGFFGTPEELQAEMERRQKMIAGVHQDTVHAVKQFLDDLDGDQLKTLDIILIQTLMVPAVAHYVRGQIAATAHIRFDICPCGKSHDPNELLDQTPLPTQVAPKIPDEPQPETEDEKQYRLMDEYNLTLIEGKFVCQCGHVYQSLEDRMLRPPGVKGCESCQQKEKFG